MVTPTSVPSGVPAGIVSVALASVQSSFSVGVSGLQWIVDGYMLAFAALMLTGGTLGDLLGRKRVMLAGMVMSRTSRRS